ncbi:MAG: carboxypeptidase-like regulatory domain-containing protein, partial [Candidatus Calescibacterium sp.]
MNENKNKGKIKLNKIFAAALLVLAGFILSSTSCTKKEEKLFFEVSKDIVSVYGYVKDYAGNPIADAEITILPTGDKIKSEKDGLYRFSVGLGELPQDAVITYSVQKSGFVTRTASISFAEILASGTNKDVAVQKRLKRQDVVLYPPAEIEIQVIDNKDNKPVAGARVLVFSSPQIALYLGVSQSESLASVTSQTSPVKITGIVPAIMGEKVYLVAFPPQGAEEDYARSATTVVDVGQIKTKAVLVLIPKPLTIIYSSVAPEVSQFIPPDANIKLIFSKEITGIDVSLWCGPVTVATSIKVSGAEVEIDPAERIFGKCTLQVNNAFGKKGETLASSPKYEFTAYDPIAPRGLACPIITSYLAGSVTGVTFDNTANGTRATYYFTEPATFDGFTIVYATQLTFIWDHPVVAEGIKDFKIRYFKGSEEVKGIGTWQTLAVTPQFRPIENKWRATLNLNAPPLNDISYGEKYYIAVIPVNLNDEEICKPEKAQPQFTIQDNTSPRITRCQIIAGATNYGAGERTVQIQFSENVTFATIATITSRIFEVVEIVRQTFNPPSNSHSLQVYLDKPKKANVPVDAENSNGDAKLLLPNDEAKKLWVGESIIVKRSNGSTAFSGFVTAIIGVLANSIVWFSGAIPGDVGNGVIEPHPDPTKLNPLQAPNNITLQVVDAAEKRFQASSTAGLTIDDKIQVVDPYSNTRKILTIT